MGKLNLRDIIGKTRRKILKLIFGQELINNIAKIDQVIVTIQKVSDEVKLESRWTSMRNFNLSIPNVSLSKLSFLVAGMDTAKYIESYMSKVRVYHDQFDLLKYCVHLAGKGLHLEFGVYSGKTINAIAEIKTNEIIHGFDSFEGLPETWRSGFEKGAFGKNELPQVRNNVQLHIGWFDETLKEFIKTNIEKCSFIHIDCDLYSSTKTIFYHLKNAIISGTILLFDEFFNYPSWRENEYKAFQEFIAEHNLSYEYIGYVEDHEQVAVRIL